MNVTRSKLNAKSDFTKLAFAAASVASSSAAYVVEGLTKADFVHVPMKMYHTSVKTFEKMNVVNSQGKQIGSIDKVVTD